MPTRRYMLKGGASWHWVIDHVSYWEPPGSHDKARGWMTKKDIRTGQRSTTPPHHVPPLRNMWPYDQGLWKPIGFQKKKWPYLNQYFLRGGYVWRGGGWLAIKTTLKETHCNFLQWTKHFFRHRLLHCCLFLTCMRLTVWFGPELCFTRTLP